MKTQLRKKWIFVLIGFPLAYQSNAQSTFPHTQAEIDAYQAKISEPRSVYGEISIVQNVAQGSPKMCEVGIFGHTNVLAYQPLPSQAIDAQLFDEDGKEVAKSWSCKFGEKPKPDRRLLDGSLDWATDALYGRSRMVDFRNWDGSIHYWAFDIVDSFRIKKPGTYRLKVQVRLFVKDTNGIFKPFLVPPVEKQVTIVNEDFRKEGKP